MPEFVTTPLTEGVTGTNPPLYWIEYGQPTGDPLLVLHGGPGASHDYLLPQMLRLGREHRLCFYDQRGGGRSRVDDPAPVTWRILVEDLAAVVADKRLDPLTIVGYSWGGLLALLYALEAGEGRVSPIPSRLVLIDPAPVTRAFRAQFEAEFERRQSGEELARLREELSQSDLRTRDPAAFRQRQFELSVAGYFADPRRATELTPFRVMGRVQQSVWESLGDYDLPAALESLRLPALVLHGWHDPIPAESSFAVARALRARLVVLEASGHVPYVEQPDTLFSAIEAFLEETSGLVRQGDD
jgi:proline iminopeptidase